MKSDYAYEMLINKAGELNLPPHSVASVFAAQQLSAAISDSPETRGMLLVNYHSIDQECVKGNGRPRLIYSIEREALPTPEALTYILKRVLKYNNEKIDFRWRSECSDSSYLYYLDAVIGDISVPLEMHIKPDDIAKMSANYRIILLLTNAAEKDIRVIAPISAAAEYSFYLMEKLLFLGDMEPMFEFYSVLKECDLEGLSVSRHFILEAKRRGVEFKGSDVDILLTLRNDRGMKSRWRGFAKREGRSGLKWEDMFKVITDFLVPVWRTLAEGEPFLGDWIGGACRFID